MKEKTANSLLAAGTFAAGLVVGIVAFLVASADGQSRAAFLSSALANVGAGLVGAAVTFVLFQVFLSRRAPSRDQVVELQARLAELSHSIEEARAAATPPAVPTRPAEERRGGSRILRLALLATAVAWILRQTRASGDSVRP